TGFVNGATLPARLRVVERAPTGTVVGIVPAQTSANPMVYSIVSGNTESAFAVDNQGVLRVANSSALDYHRFKLSSPLGAQFELLVDIAVPGQPELNETGRRVIISVLESEEPPVVNGFTRSVLEHTRVGTELGAVKAVHLEDENNLRFSIISGNEEGMFAIRSDGVITVAGDLQAKDKQLYDLTVAVRDSGLVRFPEGTGYVTIHVVTNLTPFQPGFIHYAAYDNLGIGISVSDLTNDTRWPLDPSFELQMHQLEGPSNRGDSYGAALRGWLIPPESGEYLFWIAADANGELWLSSDTNRTSMARVIYISGAGTNTGPREWTKFPSQQSTAIQLEAGQGYYLEARMKESGGGDHISIAWKGPATGGETNVISGLYLAPFPMNYRPHASGLSANLRLNTMTGAMIGVIGVTDVNTTDVHHFSIASGDDGGLFSIDERTGIIRVANEEALRAAGPGVYSLKVMVTDSGNPTLADSALVVIKVLPEEEIAADSLRREIWTNIGAGTALVDLTNNPAFPMCPDQLEVLSGFATVRNRGDNYGSRIRAYLIPPAEGAYRFFIASDDASALFLSKDDNPENAVRIAGVSGWTSVQAWTAYPQQISGLRNLKAGKPYYIEALHKEGVGNDHLEVAWAGPGIVDALGRPATNVIAGQFLKPFDLNHTPQIQDQSLRVFRIVPSGTAIGRVTVADSPLDQLSFKLTGGNNKAMFSITPDGVLTVRNNDGIGDCLLEDCKLEITVQDSGYGGLFPIRVAKANVAVYVEEKSPEACVWTGAS
ncbi:MAG TPA: cadherin domain-containing protein, partial [Clostridia bacterium]|nr:cadherin domain-containing protein [Clostridia bacterium]